MDPKWFVLHVCDIAMADIPTLHVTGNIIYVTGSIVFMSPRTVFNKVYYHFASLVPNSYQTLLKFST